MKIEIYNKKEFYFMLFLCSIFPILMLFKLTSFGQLYIILFIFLFFIIFFTFIIFIPSIMFIDGGIESLGIRIIFKNDKYIKDKVNIIDNENINFFDKDIVNQSSIPLETRLVLSKTISKSRRREQLKSSFFLRKDKI